MPAIRDTLATSLQNGALSTAELDSLVTAGTSANGQATLELKQILARFGDALDPQATQRLAEIATTLGVSFEPTQNVGSAPALARVMSGDKTLSTQQNRRDPAVAVVQRGLMRLAMMEENPAYVLPRFGADGDLGAETTAAVKTFQANRGLPPTGVVDAATVQALDTALHGIPSTSTLTNSRFKASTELASVIEGTSLGRGASGAGVTAVQQALVDLGYAFPKSGVDGVIGGETLFALKEFQRDQRLPQTGRLDAATLRKLDEVATPAGETAQLRPEYSKMVKNGVMTATVAIGFDEDGSDVWVRQQIRSDLASRGFVPFAVAGKSDEQLRAAGIDPAVVDRQATYFLAKDAKVGGSPAKILLKYIDRETPNAKERFAQSMANDSLVQYAGHARYGSGPDFDIKESTAGNFVITDPYDAHMRDILKNQGHDIDKIAMTNDYQLMFFSGCKTRDYLPGLRDVRGKTGQNLDTITSNDLLYWHRVGGNITSLLDAVMEGENFKQIEKTLVDHNDGVGFTFDGIAGNRG